MQLENSYRQIWKISFPLMMGSLSLNIVNVINTAFLARVSEVSLGASALAGVLYFAFTMVSMGIGTGLQILIAKKAGEKRYSEIGSIADHGLVIFLAVSLLFSLILFIVVPKSLSYILNLLRYSKRAYLILKSDPMESYLRWPRCFLDLFIQELQKQKSPDGAFLLCALAQ